MINRETEIVTDKDYRPAGKSGEFFYCNEKIGEKHKKDCVIVERSFVVDITIKDVVINLPASWDSGNIEYYLSGGTCGNNTIRRIIEAFEKRELEDVDCCNCMCDHVSGVFVREATEEDERNGFYIGNK